MTSRSTSISTDASTNQSAPLRRRLILTLHGVGDSVERVDEAERAYWLSRTQARSVLDLVAPHDDAVLTFDDGNESDYEIAMHELPERGLRGMFFVVANRIDTSGYLSRRQLREMHELGMMIGSHGMAHVPWRGLSAKGVQEEIGQAKDQIEQIIGASVGYAACPFGAYDRRSLNALRRAGFQDVYTSDGGEANTNNWLQTRNTIRQPDPAGQLHSMIEIHESMVRRTIRGMKSTIKRLW